MNQLDSIDPEKQPVAVVGLTTQVQGDSKKIQNQKTVSLTI